MEDSSVTDITEKFENLTIAGEPSGTQQQVQLQGSPLSERKVPKVTLPEFFKRVKS